MSSDDRVHSSGGERLNQIIAEYLGAAEAGEAVDRQELLDRHPELADELTAFFADHDKMKERPDEECTAVVSAAGGNQIR